MGIASISHLSFAQDQDFSKVEIKTIPVAENIYMLLGEGGNIGVATGADGVMLIDDQFAPLTEKIKAAVAEVSRQMLVDVKMTTEKAIADGQTLEEFIASQSTAKYDEILGGGFLKPEDFQTIVYQSLAN